MAEARQAENTDNTHSDSTEDFNKESFLEELNDPSKPGFTIPPSTLTLPKSSLDNIVEETDGDHHLADGPSSKSGSDSRQSGGSPAAERASSALPKSRRGTGRRSGDRTSDGLPNTSSTNYSTVGPSRGLDEYDLPDQWSNSRGSHMFTSPLSSPAFTPSLGGLSPEPNRKARIQIKDHGPVAKWLAKRQKKNDEVQKKPRSKGSTPRKYAPHIQPKVNTRNDEYHKSGGDVAPVRSEKLVWNAKPVVDTHNDWYVPANEENPSPPPIKNEKLHWDSKTKVDVWNTDYRPSAPKKNPVFSEKLHWYEQSKVDTKNPNYSAPEGHVRPIVDEELHWSSKNKVDTHNDLYQEPAERKPFTVFHETPQWKAHSKLDNTRPHYMPGGGNLKVKTDKLDWSAQARVDTINPSYVKPKGHGTTANNTDPSRKSTKDSNGWSSHSSDSETEWFVSTPGSERLSERKYGQGQNKQRVLKADLHLYEAGTPTNKAIVWHPRKLLFNSKDLMEDDTKLTSRSYPMHSNSKASKVPPIKPFSNYRSGNGIGQKEPKKVDKPRPVFKQRKDPLPPVGTFRHRANEDVVYPDNRPYNGYQPQRSQKIELIDMKDLSLMSKKERHAIYIN